jgi:hypothetical protein
MFHHGAIAFQVGLVGSRTPNTRLPQRPSYVVSLVLPQHQGNAPNIAEPQTAKEGPF